MTRGGRRWSSGHMDTPITTTPATTSPAAASVAWHNRPGPALVAGVGLLLLCGVFAALWMTTPFFLARALGYLSGGAGIMLVWGGVNGLREQRAENEWRH